MIIIKDWPPNIEEIRKRFDLTDRKPVFTYGNKLYNPYGFQIPKDLMVHEETHEKQQTNVKDWWSKYLTDNEFRLSQELEAYRNQYKYACDNYPRQVRRQLLNHIISSLSSKMYGSMVTKKQAEGLLKYE